MGRIKGKWAIWNEDYKSWWVEGDLWARDVREAWLFDRFDEMHEQFRGLMAADAWPEAAPTLVPVYVALDALQEVDRRLLESARALTARVLRCQGDMPDDRVVDLNARLAVRLSAAENDATPGDLIRNLVFIVDEETAHGTAFASMEARQIWHQAQEQMDQLGLGQMGAIQA